MKTGFLFPLLHSAAPAQPKRSFNSTFGLQVVFVFQVHAFHCPVTQPSSADTDVCRNPNPHSCQSSETSKLKLCIKAVIELITDITANSSVTCLKHFPITFHCSRGQIPQKRNLFCLWITFFNSKMFKPETQPWQTGCRKVQILGARYWFAFSINFFKLREVTPSSQLQSLAVVLH